MLGVGTSTRLCCIVPVLDAATSEHFFHTYQLFARLTDRVSLTVLAERGRATNLGAASVRIIGPRWAPLRLAALTLHCTKLRLQGCRTFYVRYSYLGAWASWLVTRLLGGDVYYWHCTSTIFRHSGWSVAAWRHRVSSEWPLSLTMRLVDYLVTASDALVDNYCREFRLPRRRVKIVPNDIDIERFRRDAAAGRQRREKLGLEAGQRVVMFVHRLAARKGADLLPAIARGVCAVDPSVRFVIVGSGPLEGSLRRAIGSDRLLKDRVVLTGAVSNMDMPSFYAAADVVLMPSREEGMPRVLLEALAAGVPFVAADVGAVRSVCGPGDHWSIVPAGDVDGFKTAVLELLADDKRREAMRRASAGRIAAFASERVVEILLGALGLAASVRPSNTAGSTTANTRGSHVDDRA